MTSHLTVYVTSGKAYQVCVEIELELEIKFRRIAPMSVMKN